ncbi:MAG TPA: BamA/TamA family outer membrane protein [Bryobacteraceae bacterium]|nr:BamA/TamA family outer membrane protein [Bryobacteraceae bacterium]
MRRNSPFGRMVAAVFLAGFLFGLFSARAFSWNPSDDTNVNSRYTVESVEITGASESRLSRGLRDEIKQYIGQRFSPDAFARLSGRVREELRARLVSPKLMRGSSPESVRVVLDVMGRRVNVSTDQSRLAWHGTQGLSGALTLNVEQRDKQKLTVSGFSDTDAHVERLSGVSARYGLSFLRGRVQPAFLASTGRAEYDSRTRLAAGTNELYRSVDSFQPTVTFIPWRGDDREELAVEVGMRLQRFALMSPDANRNVASHALVNTLRYRRVRGDVENGRFTLTGSAGLVNGLGGDYSFDRQELRGGLEYHHGSSRLTVDVTGGRLSGNAPFFDRFTAGNAQVLRGWNKFSLAPLGANRVTASSVEYGHRLKGKWEGAAFWDAGALWNQGQTAVARHSAGCGLRTRNGFYLYMAFPLRDSRLETMIMTGATF